MPLWKISQRDNVKVVSTHIKIFYLNDLIIKVQCLWVSVNIIFLFLISKHVCETKF